ncbi:MAG: LysM peptidoglycan-binding domain-containing protein [Bacteroidetes bacterium]|nr:LysM peptidoglycan-binding domain-containing protein [Bacteroidota bacterium]
MCAFVFLCGTVFSQTKSRDIQTIDGKKYYIHTIEKGQSLYSISKLYNVNLEDLYILNPELQAGAKAEQQIKIPYVGGTSENFTVAANPTIDTTVYYTHLVQKGETVYSLCKRYDIKEKKLNEYNPDLVNGLKEGQTIIVGEKPKRKRNKDKEREDIVVTQPAITPLPDTTFRPIVSKQKKNAYNIALILPFKLDELKSLDVDSLARFHKNFPMIEGLSIDFYLGFKKALDSLSTINCKFNLKLYDIDDSDSLKLKKLVNDNDFKHLDFIFGPLYANSFKIAAQKAKELNIPIVSPITQQNKILFDNMFISKTNPSQFTLLESLADYCMDSLMSQNARIMLLAAPDKDKRETAFVKSFKQYFDGRLKYLGKAEKDTVIIVKDMEALKKQFVPDTRNIIVSLSGNQVLVTDFNTQLALFAKKDVILCGWQNITDMENIDQEYLNQLNYTFPHQYNLLNTACYEKIVKSYKAQQNSYPSEYYFIGFDIAHYYLKNLREYGHDFIYNLDTLSQETGYMRFKFARPDNTTGFDNRGVYIFKYNNYQLQKTGWK